MLEIISKVIVKYPWFVVGFILIITIGFAILLPSIEMKTSTKDFLPDDEINLANNRVTDLLVKQVRYY